MDDRREQLERIYDEQFDYVWNSLKRCGVPERDLEDLCHEVFVTIYQKLDDYDDDRPLQPWLFGFAFRIASDYREKASNAREKLTDPDPPSQAPEVVDKLSADQARDIVMDALQEVDMERRAVFVLNELDGHAMPEVADSLAIPTNTAYSRLRAAREQFEQAVRDLLDEEERHE